MRKRPKVKKVIERFRDIELVEYQQVDNPLNRLLGKKVGWRKRKW